MAAGKDWHRRLPAVLHLAQVISTAKDAGSYEPQMMPAHRAAWLAARVGRIAALRKATPATARDWFGEPELRKAVPLLLGAELASAALPVIAGTGWGRRALRWGVRNTLRLGRRIGGQASRRKWVRNPGRVPLGLNRHLYSNRGTYGLTVGGALGGYEADRAWREASPKQRMMRDV